MTFGDALADEALEWVGTPFIWGQSQKGAGCDCKGLIKGIFAALGRPEAESMYASFANYRDDRPVPSALLLEGFNALFRRVKHMKRGDILLLRYGSPPVNIGHMAVFVGGDRAVHAYPGRGNSVSERSLRVLFHKHPLHSIWRAKRVTKCR